MWPSKNFSRIKFNVSRQTDFRLPDFFVLDVYVCMFPDKKVSLAVLIEMCYNKMNYVDSRIIPFWG